MEHATVDWLTTVTLAMLLLLLLLPLSLLMQSFRVSAAAADPYPLLDVDSFASLHLAAWRIELPAEPPAVLLEPEFPWDADVHAEGTVLIDPFDHMYKAFYVSAPETYPSGGQTQGRVLTLATSVDGLNWTRPLLDVVPWGNSSKTNILLKLASAGAELSQISVFAHPGALISQRYEMFLLGSEPPPSFTKAAAAGRLVLPGACGTVSHEHCTYRMVSSDAIHWEPIEVLDPNSDSDGSFVFREPDGSFAAYIKASTAAPPGGLAPYDVGAGGQRMMVISRSVNGSIWSRPFYCSQPDWRDSQGDQFVGLYGSDGPTEGFCGIDGKPVYLGLVGVFHTLAQTIDNQWAISKDGETWWRPERRPNVCVGQSV